MIHSFKNIQGLRVPHSATLRITSESTAPQILAMRRTAMGLMGPGLMRPIFRFLHFPLGFFTLGDPWSPKIDTANGSRKRKTNCKAMRKIAVNMNVCVSPQGACQHTAVVHVVLYDDAVCIPRYLSAILHERADKCCIHANRADTCARVHTWTNSKPEASKGSTDDLQIGLAYPLVI